MKAGIIFTGTGPILILTTFKSFDNVELARKLASKGIEKYIAYELPLEQVKQKYGAQFTMIINDVKQADDLRVLDYNGHNVFYNFDIRHLNEPILFEPVKERTPTEGELRSGATKHMESPGLA